MSGEKLDGRADHSMISFELNSRVLNLRRRPHVKYRQSTMWLSKNGVVQRSSHNTKIRARSCPKLAQLHVLRRQKSSPPRNPKTFCSTFCWTHSLGST